MEAILGFNWASLMKIYLMPAAVTTLTVDTVIKPNIVHRSNLPEYPCGFV
jgi:hypothetical protein